MLGRLQMNLFAMQWNCSIANILGPDIFGIFLLQYRGFPLSEVKNELVTRVGTKFLSGGFFIVSLIRSLLREVPL